MRQLLALLATLTIGGRTMASFGTNSSAILQKLYREVETMNLESLRLARNILFRCVVVGVCFTLLLAIATFATWDAWIIPITDWLHTDEVQVSKLVLTLFTEIRFYIVFVLLTPALAIHWTLQRELSARQKTTIKSPASMPNPVPTKGTMVAQH